MRKYLLITLFFGALSAYAQNDGAGNTGLAFLKLGVTSRAVSLGEAVVSFTEDASAVHYNPAALFMGRKVNVLFMHNEQVLGIRSEYLGAKINLQNFALGLGVFNTSVDDIEIREIPGESQGIFTAQNFGLSISAAYMVSEFIQAGLTGKFLYEKIYIDNASGYAFDLGGIYRRGSFSAGLAFANFGSMSELRSQSSKVPSSVRFGASYLFQFPKIYAGLRIGADAFKVFDGGKFHANAGAEFLYKDLLAVRLGYQSGYENKFITTGLGLKYGTFNLDYAFVPYKFSLGSSHTITLGTSF